MCACAIESCTQFIFFDDFFMPDSLLLRAQNPVVFFSLYSRGKNLSHPLNVWYRRAIFHLTTSKEKELNFLKDPTLIFYELRRNGKMWILFHFMFLVVWGNYSFLFFFSSFPLFLSGQGFYNLPEKLYLVKKNVSPKEIRKSERSVHSTHSKVCHSCVWVWKLFSHRFKI